MVGKNTVGNFCEKSNEKKKEMVEMERFVKNASFWLPSVIKDRNLEIGSILRRLSFTSHDRVDPNGRQCL